MNRWFLPSITSVLTGLSLVFINSLVPELFTKQLVAVALGVMLFLLFAYLPQTQRVFDHPWRIYIITCVLLVVPLLLPTRIRGTARWIPIAGSSFRLQPSQFAFVLGGLALSVLFARWQRSKQKTLKQTLINFGLIAIPTILVAVEPDLGTAVFLAFCLGGLLFIAGLPWKQLLGSLAVTIVVGYGAWLFLLKPYQKQRITSFLQPDQAEAGETYNVRQSLIAIGAGGITGRGIGQGSQSQLRYLPEKHTDFVFASFSEEFGLIGATLLISLYVLLTLFLIREALQMENNSHRLFLFFLAGQLFFQAMINISTNIGLVPVTGMTLPLFSYGGTSFLAFGVSLGIAQNCIQQKKRQTTLHLV